MLQNPTVLYSILAVLYLALCVITGFLARKTKVGFWGFLFLSILVTPFLPLIAILLTLPANDPPRYPPDPRYR